MAAHRKIEVGDPPTAAQARVLEIVRASLETHGRSPTNREVGAAVGHTPNAIHCHIQALVRKGHLLWTPGIARGLSLPAGGLGGGVGAEAMAIFRAIAIEDGRPLESVALEAATLLKAARERLGLTQAAFGRSEQNFLGNSAQNRNTVT